MSAEVESNPGECSSSLTANISSLSQEERDVHRDQNKPITAKEVDKQAHKGTDTAQHPDEAKTVKKSDENDKENAQNGADTSETVKRKIVEAPPPKVNPWTKRTTGRVPINNITSNSQEKDQQNTLKVVRASKPRTRKSSKSSDFSDITNWPTPGELAKEQQQHMVNNSSNVKKPPSSRRERGEREKRRERPDRKSESSHDGGDSKENQETPLEPGTQEPDEKTSSETKGNALKKRGGNKRKWVSLPLEDASRDEGAKSPDESHDPASPNLTPSPSSNRPHDSSSRSKSVCALPTKLSVHQAEFNF